VGSRISSDIFEVGIMRNETEFMLEQMSKQIEYVLKRHNIPGRVGDGAKTLHGMNFQVYPSTNVATSIVQVLGDEIAIALGVPRVEVKQHG
jgi:DNA segregation ATPase FtsK/SpoIIIE-like protein